jgi:hypothetical protein
MTTLDACMKKMHSVYAADAVKAVRGQGFIQVLHEYLAGQFHARLTPAAVKEGIEVVREATIFGSHKPKDVDLAIMHPRNGPLLWTGVRSQMSSVGKNALTYYCAGPA